MLAQVPDSPEEHASHHSGFWELGAVVLAIILANGLSGRSRYVMFSMFLRKIIDPSANDLFVARQ